MILQPNGPFGEWLYSKVGGDDFNMSKLARELGIHRASIYNHISGKCMPNRTTLRQYSDYFHEDYWYLYELTMG